MSELHRRNTLQPPHMRSAYPTEANDERLRRVDVPPIPENASLMTESSVGACDSMISGVESLNQLSIATSRLSVHTPPAMNTRKRRSWNISDNLVESPEVDGLPLSKRKSVSEGDFQLLNSNDGDDDVSSHGRRLSDERKKRRESSQSTTYHRPGPPTPAKNSGAKENQQLSMSTPVTFSPPKATPKSVKGKTLMKSPSSSRSVKLTPASLVKRVQSRLMSNKQQSSSDVSCTSVLIYSINQLDLLIDFDVTFFAL